MNTREFLKETFRLDQSGSFVLTRPRAICRDGFSISIQAEAYAYCTPRLNLADGYTAVELGYPNEPEELIMDYAEDENYTDTVYGYVPIEVVDKVLEKHGGIAYYHKTLI